MGTPHLLIGLRPIRRARRITRAELAEMIDVTPTSYSRFEAGTRRIYFDKAVQLANKLGVLVDDLTKLLDEQDALNLCDQRDKVAIAAGTFRSTLWPDAGERVPAPPSSVPAPPVESVPPPPASSPEAEVDAILDGWDVEQ